MLEITYLGVSENRGPKYRTLNSRILIIRIRYYKVSKGVWASGLRVGGAKNQTQKPLIYLWLVGNGGMGTAITTITTILPFPTNQR